MKESEQEMVPHPSVQLSMVLIFTIISSGAKMSKADRILNLNNNCNVTIWPVIQGEKFYNDSFALKPNQSINLAAPDDWSGRIWGRTGCNFNEFGNGTCETGACGTSHDNCPTSGNPPTTLAEFTLGSLDYYDVSVVDGFNLRLLVRPINGSGECRTVGCNSDLRINCPVELALKVNGKTVGCRSACQVFNTEQYCCTGNYSTAAMCQPTDYSRMFKEACPTAYSYSYDDRNSTFTCSGSNYNIDFCQIGKFSGPVEDKDDRFSGCSNITTCGNYGVCWDGQCSCPAETDESRSYFMQVNATQPNLGCLEVTPLSCNNTQLHTFVQIENVVTFDFQSSLFGGNKLPLSNIDLESCKRACLANCSCKAALFQYQSNNVSSGNCSLPLRTLNFMKFKQNETGFRSYAFIKVQKSIMETAATSASNTHFTSLIPKILPPCLSALIVFVIGACYYCYHPFKRKNRSSPCLSALIVFVIGACYYCYHPFKRKNRSSIDEEEDDDDIVPSMLIKFSFEDLRSAMRRVDRKLGGGGFGSVHEGILENGTRVAIKILESIHQGKREFMAELNTIGNIHHVNLVRLIGYCTEGSNKLLVYEHMCNGSLDKWIFDENRAQTLNWEVREKIIFGIAKGLEYLHEHCSHRIIHFDIKPQNILLDQNFNAKISDFGLAKLIDRNQSQVLTGLKGTRGYAAPELIMGRNVSVKADVYSFGIVILEIVCGRKNLKFSSTDQEDYSLINMVKIKAEEDRLSDLIDDCSDDMQCHKGEAVKMMEIAIRCLQPHFRRPTVSMVVKVLEGAMDMEPISDYSFLTMIHIGNPSEARPAVNSAPPMSSLLSGPR